MRRRTWIFTLLVLLLATLACGGGTPSGEGAKLSGTYSPATPVGEYNAKTTIQTYARDVLGLQITDLLARGTSGEINIPISTQDGLDAAIELAGTTYSGLWKNGLASLSFGDTSVSGETSPGSAQELLDDIEDGSLGIFTISLEQTAPSDVSTALGLLLGTFPGVAGYEFVETPVEKGFAFTAGKVDDINLREWQINLTGTTITAGAAPGIKQGKTLVWIVIASGALATPFE